MANIPELHNALQSSAVAASRRLVLLDTDASVLAYSIHETRTDRARLAHVMTHSDLWGIGLNPRPRPVELDLAELGRVALVSLVGSDQHLLATVVYPLESEEVAEDASGLLGLEEMQVVRGLLQAEQSVQHTFTAITSELVSELIADDESGRRIAAQELLELKRIGRAEKYTTVVLGPGRDHDSKRDTQKVRLAVSSIIRFVISRSTSMILGGMDKDGLGILIFPRPVQMDQLIRRLETPELTPVRAGVGPMASLDNLYEPYRRARWALFAATRLPEKYPAAVKWQDLGIDGYVSALPVTELWPEDLPGPLSRIMQDPHVRHWVGSLKTYLELRGDVARAAEAQQIHRSTMYYRLERMAKVADIDLSDSSIQAEMLFAMRLLNQIPRRAE